MFSTIILGSILSAKWLVYALGAFVASLGSLIAFLYLNRGEPISKPDDLDEEE